MLVSAGIPKAVWVATGLIFVEIQGIIRCSITSRLFLDATEKRSMSLKFSSTDRSPNLSFFSSMLELVAERFQTMSVLLRVLIMWAPLIALAKLWRHDRSTWCLAPTIIYKQSLSSTLAELESFERDENRERSLYKSWLQKFCFVNRIYTQFFACKKVE